jgi:hypothetical protein
MNSGAAKSGQNFCSHSYLSFPRKDAEEMFRLLLAPVFDHLCQLLGQVWIDLDQRGQILSGRIRVSHLHVQDTPVHAELRQTRIDVNGPDVMGQGLLAVLRPLFAKNVDQIIVDFGKAFFSVQNLSELLFRLGKFFVQYQIEALFVVFDLFFDGGSTC